MKQVLRDERGMRWRWRSWRCDLGGSGGRGVILLATQEQRMAESSRFHGSSRSGGSPSRRLGADPYLEYNDVQWPRRTRRIRGHDPVDAGASNTGSFNGSVYKLADNLYLFDVTGRDTMSRPTAAGGASISAWRPDAHQPLPVDIPGVPDDGNTISWRARRSWTATTRSSGG